MGVGVGIWGLEFGVWGLEFRVWGLEFGVWGLGFEVWDLGCRVYEGHDLAWTVLHVPYSNASGLWLTHLKILLEALHCRVYPA